MDQTENPGGATERQGLSLREKEDFVRRALPAMAQYTFGFVCRVIGIPGPQLGRHWGTGLRCILSGRRAIVTAFHVIAAARNEPNGFAISTGPGEAPYIVHGDVNIDPVADLAIYFLPDDYPDKAFWPSTRIENSLDRLDTDYLFLHGFPGATSYPSRLLGGIVSRSLPYGAMRRLENLPPDLQPFQFAVEYDPIGMMNTAGLAQDVTDPSGLSGSPVWRIGVGGRSSRDWKPDDSLLVGVLTQWRSNEKVLVATSTATFPPRWVQPQAT